MIPCPYTPPTKQDMTHLDCLFRFLQWKRLRLSLIVLAACAFWCVVALIACDWEGFIVGSVCGCIALWRMMNYVPIDWTVVTGARSWLVRLKY